MVGAKEGRTRFAFSQMHMGVAVRITLFAADWSVAEKVGKAAFDRVAQLDETLSAYIQTSEVSRLVRRAGNGPVTVGPDLYHVLQAGLEWARQSDGAFDVTVAPLTALWKAAFKRGHPPCPALIEQALSRVGPDKIRLDSRARSVDLDPGVEIDLGAIGKGYACDEALRVIRDEGIESAMIEAGGDLAVLGTPPGSAGWDVAIDGRPGPPLSLSDQALSTSGDSVQGWEFDAVRYSHVVDPRTGRPTTHRLQATVVGPSCTMADALATLAGVDPVAAERLAPRYGATVLIYRPGSAGRDKDGRG